LLKREREHDWHIMDAIVQCGLFSPAEIRQLNYCRLYLQVSTISDLATAQGESIDKNMARGLPAHSSCSTNKWHNVNQQRPADKQWLLWQRANLLWSNEEGKLHQPLGKWLLPPSQQRRWWSAYASTDGQVYVRAVGEVVRYNRHCISHTQHHHDGWYQVNTYTEASVKLPENVFPVPLQLQTNGTRVVYLGHPKSSSHWKSRCFKPRIQPATNHDFARYIGETDSWEFELLQYVDMKFDAFTICQLMQDGFEAACDGSVEDHTNGSFGWTVATSLGNRIVTAFGPVRGKRPSSYRAEGYGMLSFHLFLVRLQKYCSQTIGSNWNVTSDNLALVNKLNGGSEIESIESQPTNGGHKVHDWSEWREIPCWDTDDTDEQIYTRMPETSTDSATDPDWDVINKIQWIRERGGIQVGTITHVQGHQDRKTPYHELSLSAQLNVDAALRAKYSYFIISCSWVKDRCNGDVVVGLLIIVRLIDNLL
jgi:hypothetical protein